MLDSALMVLAAGAVRELLAELKAATSALAGLAEAHAAHAVCGPQPDPALAALQLRAAAAQWFNGLAAAARRLEAVELPVQTGGAAGTLAAGTVL